MERLSDLVNRGSIKAAEVYVRVLDHRAKLLRMYPELKMEVVRDNRKISITYNGLDGRKDLALELAGRALADREAGDGDTEQGRLDQGDSGQSARTDLEGEHDEHGGRLSMFDVDGDERGDMAGGEQSGGGGLL